MHHSSGKSKKRDKGKTSQEISPEVFHQIFEKDQKQHAFLQSLNVSGDPKHTPPEIKKEFTISTSHDQRWSSSSSGMRINDQEFYDAFDPHKKTDSIISPALFEDMIRRDKMKKDFVKKFTNVYDDSAYPGRSPVIQYGDHPRNSSPYRARSPRHESPSHRAITSQYAYGDRSPHRHSSSPYRTSRGSSLVIVNDSAGQHARILYCDIDNATADEIKTYLNKYWNNDCAFPSMYPLLMKLERENGPGWRLDKISEPHKVHVDAWPNSTINFEVPPQPTMFSLWRQRT